MLMFEGEINQAEQNTPHGTPAEVQLANIICEGVNHTTPHYLHHLNHLVPIF